MGNIPLYLDTNIYMDFFLNRDKSNPAMLLLLKALSCKYKIVISNIVLNETKINQCGDDLKALLMQLTRQNKLINIFTNPEDRREVEKLIKERDTPYNDTLHAVLCKKSGASHFVTRNMKDFVRLKDIVDLKYPEEL